MLDQIENMEYGGVIHHGKLNNRVYVLKLPKENIHRFIKKIENIALGNQYGKIIVKCPTSIQYEFIKDKYDIEAKIPNYYNGNEDLVFLSKYMTLERNNVGNKDVIEKVIEFANTKKNMDNKFKLEKDFICRKANKEDVAKMVSLYKKVFVSYPFPIHNSQYIIKTMKENVIYFGIWYREKLVGLSSCEIDIENKNAEMTDFAVHPSYRGKNIALYLLRVMEEEMKRMGIILLYTIARSISYGMNCSFSKNGYNFAGTLYNNTHISGDIESMNIWYKNIKS